jgi:signal transduction histidine kinase
MLINLLFAIAVALTLFFVSNVLFDGYIENRYLSEEKKAERIEEYKKDLQRYVTENGLACDDTKQISDWAKDKKYLYILVYKDDKLLFETGQYEEEKVENKENADEGTKKPVLDNDDPKLEDDQDGDNVTGDDTSTGDPSDTDGNDQTGDGNDQTGDGDSQTGDGTDVSDDTQDPEDQQGDSVNSDSANTEDGDDANDAEDQKNQQNKTENDKNDTDKSDSKYQSTGITVKTPTREELISEAEGRGSHAIEALDGTLLVSMADYTEYLFYDIFNIVSIFLAFTGFILVMWIYFLAITKKITRLGREVTAVADGDINHVITTLGADEITRLCSDVEYMRISMLENIEKERAALEANRELITAMSHDIRTPLTVLLGYLDIMKSNAPDDDMQQYIEASERTALRLKKMSDDMFGYFLVYGGGIEVEIDECDARTLIDQMLSGHVFLLREQGYDITFNFESQDSDFLENIIVVTDPPQLMRIVENIFSNIMKYADKEKPVIVEIGSDTDEMSIKVSNYVAKVVDEAQKNGIGLRSCMKLANAMDIRFSSSEEDGIFVSEMYIPIIPELDIPDVENMDEREGFIKWLKSISEKFKTFASALWSRMKDFSKRK